MIAVKYYWLDFVLTFANIANLTHGWFVGCFDLMVLVKNVTTCLMVATHGYLVTAPVLSLNHRTGVCCAMVWGRLGNIFIPGIVNYWKLRSDVARASSDPTGSPTYAKVLHRRPISAAG